MNASILPWKAASAVYCAGMLTEGWNLTTVPEGDNDVPRTFTAEILFPEPFRTAPVVHAAIAGFDMDQRDSSRISVAVSGVTATGFTVAITAWRETRVYSVEVSWLVIGH